MPNIEQVPGEERENRLLDGIIPTNLANESLPRQAAPSRSLDELQQAIRWMVVALQPLFQQVAETFRLDIKCPDQAGLASRQQPLQDSYWSELYQVLDERWLGNDGGIMLLRRALYPVNMTLRANMRSDSAFGRDGDSEIDLFVRINNSYLGNVDFRIAKIFETGLFLRDEKDVETLSIRVSNIPLTLSTWLELFDRHFPHRPEMLEPESPYWAYEEANGDKREKLFAESVHVSDNFEESINRHTSLESDRQILATSQAVFLRSFFYEATIPTASWVGSFRERAIKLHQMAYEQVDDEEAREILFNRWRILGKAGSS